MAAQEGLVRKRGSIKSKVTLFKKYIYGLPDINVATGEVKLNIVLLNELEERLLSASDLLKDFEIIQEKLLELNVDAMALSSETEAFEAEFYSIKALAKTIIQFNKTIVSSSTLKQAQDASQVSQISDIKLPDIPLKKFDGSLKTWLEFRDSFVSGIHENKRVSDILKFKYLRASLEENVLRVINSIDLCADNYNQAWNTLCNRYNNVKSLINHHIEVLFNFEQITYESSEKLRVMVDSIKNNLKSLKQLDVKTENWDPLLIYIIYQKLDSNTAREWEVTTIKQNSPELKTLIDFLNDRADLLERIEKRRKEKRPEPNPKQRLKKSYLAENKRDFRFDNKDVQGNFKSSLSCVYCKKGHYVYQCTDFQNLALPQRWEQVRSLKLCHNCLRGGHRHESCRFSSCKVCKKMHNSILHDFGQQEEIPVDNVATEENATVSSYSGIAGSSQVLLSTAQIFVYDANGKCEKVRCLLDSGSQVSIATSDLCRRLQLNVRRANLSVSGLSNSVTKIKGKCSMKIKSMHNDFETNIVCYIMTNISGYLPNVIINPTIGLPSQNIKLADPKFHIPGKVDLLIGADIFWSLICEGQLRSGKNQPIFQKTTLGWVVAGPISNTSMNIANCNFLRECDVQEQLANFWEIEEIPNNKQFSVEEQLCEEHFKSNTRRNEHGQFIVSIPFKDDINKLGDSKQIALRQFNALERRLNNNREYKSLYCDFMKEYEALGHMRKLSKNSVNRISYFLPHHGVLRTESSSTRLRVVFNASSRSSSGLSLNDIQMVGPTIQKDLLSILLNFRIPVYVVTADIEKMYRQILIDEGQHNLQKILWRSDISKEINEYELLTVTYGTASAPYLAIKCLDFLGDECKETLPEVSKIIKNNFYVDDVLFGRNDIREIQELCINLQSIMKSGGFTLRKWKSNDTRAIEFVTDNRSEKVLSFDMSGTTNKTLGLGWVCAKDKLVYNTKNINFSSENTKRAILSNISKVFDPLGLLSPVIIVIKILLQKLWLEKLDWNDILPTTLSNSWSKFNDEIHELDNIQITRRVVCKNATNVQLHAFCDSSIQAYGSCLYIRSENKEGEVFVHLLCAKSKVAPLKSLTIPKLELCGALIATRLVAKIMKCLEMQFDKIFMWTDSTIVLGWLKTTPNLLKPFVNSRVAEIQSLSKPVQWCHVSTNHNPADILSRGLNPIQLKDEDRWWFGPDWLQKPNTEWPATSFNLKSLPEMRTNVKSFFIQNSVDIFAIERFSNLQRLKRTAAYVCRFIENCRKPASERKLCSLTTNEIDSAFERVLKIIQEISFFDDYTNLMENRALNKTSRLLDLNPFHENGLIRVGGRLRNSKFDYSKKHPILLPHKNHLTQLIFADEHVRLFHAGPQQLLASIREKFWPLLGRNLAKKTVRNCVICFKFSKANKIAPIMADLPKARVEPSFSFEKCGTDFAGPFLIKDKKGRGSRTSKCYLCLFICLSTKAIHLELATDLSTECFILCLRRFVSRRGKPRLILSDNGRNYVGATKELSELGEFLTINNRVISERASTEGIQWTFIPPYSPHMGGIWEAGIKSTKFHLYRVFKNAKLTFEEFYTVVAQIEAILNSRPLFPLSSDPNDLTHLTPAHFLVGRSLNAIPHPRVIEIPENRLSRFQHLQKLQQHFWERWSKEYISELQQRSKWKSTQSQLTTGTIVLIKEDCVPPMNWTMGRVLEIHPGRDGVARIATLRTKDGTMKRSFSKICPLPINDDALKVFHTFQGGRDVQNPIDDSHPNGKVEVATLSDD